MTKTFITTGFGLVAAAAITLTSGQASAQGYGSPPPPPPPGFEPQAAPPPAGYYVPNSVAQSGPRQINDWEEGEPVPPGYHPVSRIRKGFVVGGAVTFGTLYLITVISAAVYHDASGGSGSANGLYIPVVGPFVQMANTSSATGNVFLAIDGLGQAAGAALLIAGIAAPKMVLVRNDLAKVEIQPGLVSLSKSATGFGFTGTF